MYSGYLERYKQLYELTDNIKKKQKKNMKIINIKNIYFKY